MHSAGQPITYADRVVIILAVKFGCDISAATERLLRANERALVVDQLRNAGIDAISRHPSHRRMATRRYRCAADLVAEVRRDERQLIIRELRREARMLFALGLDGDALESVAKQIENGTRNTLSIRWP
jgi:hypothetical protein